MSVTENLAVSGGLTDAFIAGNTGQQLKRERLAAVGVTASSIVIDLRNPLATILGWLRLLGKDGPVDGKVPSAGGKPG